MNQGRRIGPWLLPGLIVLLGLAIGAYWVGPAAVASARLELLALDAASRFAPEARLALADSASRTDPRYPLILAVRNLGPRATTVETLRIAVPDWVRLYDRDGDRLVAEDAGETLVGYRIALTGERIEPGALPTVPAGLDRLWISSDLTPMTCRLRWDGVPELALMPEYDPDKLATIHAFYSLEGRRDRSTGQLTIQLDPTLVGAREAGPFQLGEVTLRPGGAALPRVTGLQLEGSRNVSCGAPERRVAFEAVVWRTGANAQGRWIVISREGMPRKLLYDVDGDARVELEAWDGDGNGTFEASRPVSFGIPSFLLPPPPAPLPATDSTGLATPPPAGSLPDSTPRARPRADSGRADSAANTRAPRTATDSAANVRVPPARADSGAGVSRPPARADSAAADRLRRARADSLRADSTRRARARLDSMVQARLRLDSLRRDSIRRDSIRRDTIRRDTIRRDTTGFR